MATVLAPEGSAFQPVLFDLDNDGDLDFAALHGGGATIFRNLGNFSFANVETIPVAGGLILGAAADLFANGRKEFVATSFAAGKIAIFRNVNGNIGLDATITTGSGPLGVDLADLDKDGDLDIVNANVASDSVTISKRVANGAYVPNAVSLGTESEPVYVRAADLNRDGKADLVISHRTATDIVRYTNLGHLEFDTPAFTPANGSPFAIVVSDVDDDGVADLMYSESQTGRAAARMTQTDGTFGTAVTNFASQYSVTTALFMDLDGDGLPEFFTSSAFSALIQIHKNLSQ
jgi:hypothetical protein